MVGDGGLEGFRCPAVEGARVCPDPNGGGCPNVELSRGGGRLEGVSGGEGLCSPSCRMVHTCAHVSAHPLTPVGCLPCLSLWVGVG